jgi:fluoride exporter
MMGREKRMRKYIFIGSGGILGALLRYYIKNMNIYHYNGAIPLNTLIINITGSFVLALILTIALEIYEFDSDIRLGIGTGFLGAYTTFSTMCKEAVLLISSGYYYSAISYITVSTILGLGAAYLGVLIAREFVAKIVEVRRYKTIAEAEIASDVEKGGK